MKNSDFTHAAEFYERARKDYEEDGIDPATREFDEERAALCRMRGDLVTARNLLENLHRSVRQKNKNETGFHTVRLALCRVQLEQKEIGDLIEESKKFSIFSTSKIFIITKRRRQSCSPQHFSRRINAKEMLSARPESFRLRGAFRLRILAARRNQTLSALFQRRRNDRKTAA